MLKNILLSIKEIVFEIIYGCDLSDLSDDYFDRYYNDDYDEEI